MQSFLLSLYLAIDNGLKRIAPSLRKFFGPLCACAAIYAIMEQVNGAINSRGELFGIGITTHYFWVLVNPKIGVDFEWNPNRVTEGRLGDWGLDVNMEKLIVDVQCQNAAFRVELISNGLVDLQITITDR